MTDIDYILQTFAGADLLICLAGLGIIAIRAAFGGWSK